MTHRRGSKHGKVRTVVTAGALMLLAACSGATEEDWPGSIEERDGVVWINNPAADPQGPGDRAPFALVLEQTFGVEDEPVDQLLSFIMGVAVDRLGNVYVVDRSDNRLVAFAPDGTVLWKGGREGQGPGEFNGPNYIAWDGEDLLYVDNHSAGQIDVWSTAGEYVGSRGLADFDISQGYPVGFADPSTFVLTSNSRTDGDAAIVHVFDVATEWRRTARFVARGGRPAEGSEPAFWGSPKVRVAGTRVWAGNVIDYELHEYDLEGRLQRVLAREHAPLTPTFVYRGTGFGFGEFEPPLWLNGERGLVARYGMVGFEGVEEFKRRWDEYLASRDPDRSPVRSYESAIDLVDAEGRVLSSLPIDGAFWDSIGTLETVGSDGRVYTRVFEPYPHVRRYRVEIADSIRR